MRGRIVAGSDQDALKRLLQQIARRLDMLERRPDGRPGIASNLPSFVPEIHATTTDPPGTRDTQDGLYALTEIIGVRDWVQCTGFGTIRIGSGVGRGNGLYMLDLPLEVVLPTINGREVDDWFNLGTVSLGLNNLTHNSAYTLNRNGGGSFDTPGPGGRKFAVISGDYDWIAAGPAFLFAGHTIPQPGVNIGNIHYQFSYPVPRDFV